MTIIQASRLGQPGVEILELLKEIRLTLTGQQDGLFLDEDKEEAKIEYVLTSTEMIEEKLALLKEV